jgi:hypothetical protein
METDRERYPRDPANEADHIEDGEDQENDAARPVPSTQHIDGRHETKHNVQDAGCPDELLGEQPGHPYVCVACDYSDDKTEGKEDDCVGGQPECIRTSVNPRAIEAVGVCVALDRDAADGCVAKKDCDELEDDRLDVE